MTETTNCGACGDRVPVGVEHFKDCWVINKVQTQETVLELCQVCDEPIYAPHWRCVEQNV